MRKSLFVLIFLLGVTYFSRAQEKESVTLTIDVSITKYKKGNLYLAIYDSKENYMKKSYKSASEKVNDNSLRLVFQDIPKGDYAFSFYHDVNGNEKMDTNFLGIPKEPYGFSNNQKGRFGPPKFEKAKFNIDKDKYLEIHLK